jgi:hypothetical protein
MKVITIATDLENPFLQQLLVPSCGRVGLDLVILHAEMRERHGGGATEDERLRRFQFRDKRLILADYLTQQSLGDELFVFTDAYDALFLRGEQYIREAYARFPQRIVFSGEENCWPLGVIGFALQEDPPVGPYPYLNSGGFIAPASDVLSLLNKYPEPASDRFPLLGRLRSHGYDTDRRFGHSDQYYWTLIHMLEPEIVGIDNTARLFETFGPPVADVWDPKAKIGIREFVARGKDAVSYQEERARLEVRLQSPSDAAQLHFNTTIAKSVLLDLYAEGQLPAWLRDYVDADAVR